MAQLFKAGHFTEGDLGVVVVNIRHADTGELYDLTGKTVWTIYKFNDEAPSALTQMQIIDASKGQVSFSWASGDLKPGKLYMLFRVRVSAAPIKYVSTPNFSVFDVAHHV
jgi:hypothetical protein